MILKNLPLSADVSLTGHTHTSSDIDNFPIKISQFENDTGYLSTHRSYSDISAGIHLSDYATKDTDLGLQIFDKSKLNELEEKGIPLPNDYIEIPNIDQTQSLESICQVEEVIDKRTTPNPLDLSGKLAYQVTYDNPHADKSYIDIIFQSLRSLQAEVARLRNTMRYGLYSYKDEHTALAAMVDEYKEPENEPLWAIDEADLSPVNNVNVEISENHCLQPHDHVIAGDGVLSIDTNKSAAWIDDDLKSISSITDSKLYLYLTTSTMNTNISIDNIIDGDDVIKQYIISLSSFGVVPIVQEKYNILFVVSRAYYDTYTREYYGNNFVWLTIASFGSLNKKVEGYWNPIDNRLQDDIYILGQNTGLPLSATLSANRYFIKSAEFTDPQRIYKFDMYSKYQNFQNEVEPNTPTDSGYKYEVAHITIRSVKNEEVLKKIIKQLPQDELIYNQDNNSLYIVNTTGNYKKISGGGGGGEDEGMTEEQIKQWLKNNGIHLFNDSKTALSAGQQLSVENLTIGDITFINEDTKKQFKFTCDPYGQLHSAEILSATLESRIAAAKWDNPDHDIYTSKQVRGFVGNLMLNEHKQQSGTSLDILDDAGEYSDRIKIGAIYAPKKDQDIFGCSHAYIELENTLTTDFQLKGCYLHYAKQNANNPSNVYERSIALTGVIPAGGTYLIRGKQYTELTASNCVININEYDQEWYSVLSGQENIPLYEQEKELIDFSLSDRNTFLLTYGFPGKDLLSTSSFDYNTSMIRIRSLEDEPAYDKDKCANVYDKHFIDVVSIGAPVEGTSGTKPWTENMKYCFEAKSYDCIYKNTFFLDPAKQGFQALAGCDSSRIRNANANDYQYVNLTTDKIEFPKTNATYDIRNFTPKASHSYKNVCTDKTQLNMNKPNYVTCAFGIDLHRTRCFNWISSGKFNEFVWIRKKSNNINNWIRFESYTGKTTQIDEVTIPDEYTNDTPTSDIQLMTKKIFDVDVIQSIYKRVVNVFPGCNITYTAHKCIVDILPESQYVTEPIVYEYTVGRANKFNEPDINHTSEIYTFTLYPTDYMPRVFQTTDQQGFHWIEYQPWAAAAEEINKTITEEQFTTKTATCNVHGKDFDIDLPDDCIQVLTKKYSKDLSSVFYLNGKYYEFTTDTPTIVEITCDITYKAYNKIIPVLINTGDMTQNGTRINEWLDYYNAGKCLFNHLEQMNVVGNNDLCGTDPTLLGTGDDIGKSNSYYFYIFHCYEVDQSVDDTGKYKCMPIIKGKYVPSLYYFENKNNDIVYIQNNLAFDTDKKYFVKKGNTGTNDDYEYAGNITQFEQDVVYYTQHDKTIRFIMVNSEITVENCANWFNAKLDGYTVNVYTGWQLETNSHTTLSYDNSFTTIYTMLYNMMYSQNKNKNIIVACHEMPFTVITSGNIATSILDSTSTGSTVQNQDRSTSGTTETLVGSHLNLLSKNDKKSNYWFSRLLEYFNVKLCIGGHKHTYSCTWPVRELYFYNVNEEGGESKLSCSLTKPMTMLSSLDLDTVVYNRNILIDHLTDEELANQCYILQYYNKDNSGQDIKEKDKSYKIYTSKYPIVNKFALGDHTNIDYGLKYTDNVALYPFYVNKNDNYHKVVYFMLQATGYKLKSNKELPSPKQAFSYIVPNTEDSESEGLIVDAYQYPMFGEIEINDTDISYNVYLRRIKNILLDNKHIFNQEKYGTGTCKYEYIFGYDATHDYSPFGHWEDSKKQIITI